MRSSLRLLLVEDSDDDAQLVVRALERPGTTVAYERVFTRDAFLGALGRGPWDLVVSDHRMPAFTSTEALRLTKESGLDIPFIIVSGTIGEDQAVVSMKAGASDYILKGDLRRLAPAVERELREAEERRATRALERALHETGQHLRAVLQHAGEGILTLDESGRIEFFNPAAEVIFGTPAAGAVGTHADRFLGLAYQGLIGVGPRELVGRRADGAPVAIDVMVSEMEAGTRRSFICTARDVSERKALQQQIQQSQRMEAIGTFAGGIAHDFNNILTLVIASATAGLGELPDDHAAVMDLRVIEQQARRASTLVKQLLAFARRQELDRVEVDLNHVVREMEKFLCRVIGERTTLQTVCAPDLRTTLADSAQVEQVLMNLCINARDAMPSGGSLRIETANVGSAEASRCLPTGLTGDFVVVRVIDSGTGMDGATLQRIFDPFFTTKEPGKGTGLGLAVAYGIIQQHGGAIHVDSQIGQGTTFSVCLPAIQAPPSSAQSLAETRAPSPGTETILVAEDDDGVRRAIKRILTRQGYAVVEASDGEGAARALAENRAIALATLDGVMPGLSGQALVKAIRAIRPDLPILLVSGYGAGTLEGTLREDPLIEVVPKPFEPADLALKVRRALDRGPRRA